MLYRIVNFLARMVFFSLYPRKVIGQDQMPAQGPVIVVCNHKYFFDVFNLTTIFGRRLTFMAKKELFQNRILGALIRRYGAFPVDRDGNDLAAIRSAMAVLKKDGVLAIFPEGTRSHGIVLGELKQGVALIAQKSGAQILPVYINHTDRIFARMQVHVGAPFTLPPTTRADAAYLAASMETVREKMLALCDAPAVLEEKRA